MVNHSFTDMVEIVFKAGAKYSPEIILENGNREFGLNQFKRE